MDKSCDLRLIVMSNFATFRRALYSVIVKYNTSCTTQHTPLTSSIVMLLSHAAGRCSYSTGLGLPEVGRGLGHGTRYVASLGVW